MGRRCKFWSLLATCFIGILATSYTTYSGWVHGTNRDASLVSVRTGFDAREGLGIQQTRKSDSSNGSESLLGRKGNEKIIWDKDTMNMIDILSFEEGYSSKPYLCKEGYVTVGLGTRLHTEKGLDPRDFPILVTPEIAEAWLHMRVEKHKRKLSRRTYIGPIFNKLDEDRKAIILSMSYQMGTSGVANFKKMWKALEGGNYELAEREALDSLWATQTPNRAKRHSQVLAGKPLSEIYFSQMLLARNN